MKHHIDQLVWWMHRPHHRKENSEKFYSKYKEPFIEKKVLPNDKYVNQDISAQEKSRTN